MRIFGIAPELRNYRLMKIGFWGYQLYISPWCTDRIQIWSIHSFIPNSWSKLFDFPLIQLFYSFYALSPNEPFIYALVVALFECDVPRISILRIYMDSGACDVFNLDEVSGNEFENKVFFENVVLGCGKQLYMYERSVVMGPIPFWKITLLEDSMTFTITNETICTDENEERCSRFPIVLDGDRRKVFKLLDNHDIVVFDGESNSWSTYPPASNTAANLNLLRVRGICETYGQTVHRMGAVESPLTFYVSEGICIAKIFRHSYHIFYHIIFDDERKVYRVIPAGKYRLPMHIQLRFYGLYNDNTAKLLAACGMEESLNKGLKLVVRIVQLDSFCDQILFIQMCVRDLMGSAFRILSPFECCEEIFMIQQSGIDHAAQKNNKNALHSAVPRAEPITLVGIDITSRSEGLQFIILCCTVFIFYIIYGFVQELMFKLDDMELYGWHLTLIQFSVCSAMALLESFCYATKDRRRIPLHIYLQISTLTVGTIGFSNVAVGYLNYPTQVVFKCWKQYSWIDFIAACMMSFGLAIFILGDSAVSPIFNPFGYAMISIALLFDAVIGNIQEKSLHIYRATNNEMHPLQTYGYGILFSISGYLGLNAILSLVRTQGALTAVTVTTARKAITITLSFLFFSKPFTAQYLWGGLLIVIAIYLNLYSKSRSNWKHIILNFIRYLHAVNRHKYRCVDSI
uniref:Adenosine 3'-phospho 5'-phosphosulfate transporter 2 n=1 Tax=Setaria digitata TaxID=48799 RepID=A0A915Q6I2_9BILA